jgi:hypothetical protein
MGTQALVDTGLKSGHWVYGPQNSGGVANQFATMPSLHVGWAALIALSMIVVLIVLAVSFPVLLRPGLRDDPRTLRNSFSPRCVLK